jgi:predicted Zn-dependent protease
MTPNISDGSLRVLAAAAFALLLFATPFAMAGGDNNNKSDAATTCPIRQVWDAKNNKCVEKKSGVLPNEALTDYAYALAKAERYDEALDVLDTLQNPNTAKALNYRSYATRKLGQTQEGVSYYLKSVALDPNYTKVREYLGEAYVIQGKLDLAKDQLATIAKLCGSTQCEEYGDLSQAITKAHGL